VTVCQTIAQAHFALAQQAILQTTLQMMLTMMILIVANICLAEIRLAGCLAHQRGSPQVLSADNTLQQYLSRLG